MPIATPANISAPKPSGTPNSAPASVETTRNNWINTPEALAGIAVLGLSWVGLVRRRQQQPSSETPDS
ncbi:MAG TPA: hypothetical protein VNZ22_09550, partial [Bacillota bacterium]|nr:hypothetical protein [Bacillota bacterium]